MSNKEVEELVNKACSSDKADDALKFSQAALNAAHAFNVLQIIVINKPEA